MHNRRVTHGLASHHVLGTAWRADQGTTKELRDQRGSRHAKRVQAREGELNREKGDINLTRATRRGSFSFPGLAAPRDVVEAATPGFLLHDDGFRGAISLACAAFRA